jgi:DNA-binding NtrC family response regulator
VPGGGASLARSSAVASLLVVEHDPDLCLALRDVLERERYQVTSAADAREALDHLREHTARYALILVDWILPGAAAMELVDAIARAPVHAGTPLVAMSMHDRVPAAVSAVIAKPFRMRTLLHVVARLAQLPRRVHERPSVRTTRYQGPRTVVMRRRA